MNKKDELVWINQIFAEVKDQFLKCPEDMIKFDNFKQHPKWSDIHPKDLKYIQNIRYYANIICVSSLFVDVVTELKRMQNIFKDDGYTMDYRVSHNSKNYSSSHNYSIAINVFENKLMESKSDIHNIHLEQIEWLKQVFADLEDVGRYKDSKFGSSIKINRIYHKPYQINDHKDQNVYVVKISCTDPDHHKNDLLEELKRTKNILADDNYEMDIYDIHKNHLWEVQIFKKEESIKESKEHELEWIKQVFAEITDVLPECISEIEDVPFCVRNNKEIITYKFTITCGEKNYDFVKDELDKIADILKDDKYDLRYTTRDKYIAHHIITRMSRYIKDAKVFSITIQKEGGQAHKDLFDVWEKERNKNI